MKENPWLEQVRAGVRWALIALIVLSPLPFGSVSSWAVLTIELVATILGAAGIWVLLAEPGAWSRRVRWVAGLALVPVIVGLMQWVPVSAAWTTMMAHSTAQLRTELAATLPEIAAAAAPPSFSAPDTLDAVARYVAYVLIGIGAIAAFRTAAHVKHAAIAIAASGAFQALYGSAEYLSGHQHILGWAKKYYLEEATGTFVNRNHFAGYLALTMTFGLWLLADGIRRTGSRVGTGGGPRRRFRPTAAKWVPTALAIAIIWIGVILSNSRAGIAAALLVVVLFLARVTTKRRVALVVMALIVLPILWLIWQDVRAPAERFWIARPNSSAPLDSRVPVWQQGMSLFRQYPTVGVGLGTFEEVFQDRWNGASRGRWQHAHNDWLQAGIEGGTVVAVTFGLMLVITLCGNGFQGSIGDVEVAPRYALFTAAVLAFVDFQLRVPAYALLVGFVGGLAYCELPIAKGPRNSVIAEVGTRQNV